MSKFLQPDIRKITPYVPGEQLSGRQFIKLNTNESPYPPSEKAIRRAAEELLKSNLYPPLDGGPLRLKLAEVYGLIPEQIVVTNGSDEALNFIFRAFCSKDSPAVFPDITYGFYKVFAALNGVPYTEIPLDVDLKIRAEDYIGIHKNIFIANPNAPTGIAIGLDEISEIAQSNPDNIVVIDEAYVDFGGESAIGLLRKHQNLIVVRTFSKSRSLAGARVGFAIAHPEIIQDLYTVIYSTNPYNLSRANMAAGLGALEDEEYTKRNCEEIKKTRESAAKILENIGFKVLPSSANFLFITHEKMRAKDIYLALKECGVLVRYFDSPRINNYLRVTVGSPEQMNKMLEYTENILKKMR